MERGGERYDSPSDCTTSCGRHQMVRSIKLPGAYRQRRLFPEPPDDKQAGDRAVRRIAVTRIHLLGWIQQVLIEEHWPTPVEDEDEEEDDPDQEGYPKTGS